MLDFFGGVVCRVCGICASNLTFQGLLSVVQRAK